MSSEVYGPPEVRITDDALRAAWSVPAPIPAEHDRVSSYALRCLAQAAPLIVAAELDRIVASIDGAGDPAADAWLKAEACGRRDVRRILQARASELRGEGKDGDR